LTLQHPYLNILGVDERAHKKYGRLRAKEANLQGGLIAHGNQEKGEEKSKEKVVM